jgi:hypothetical protein
MREGIDEADAGRIAEQLEYAGNRGDGLAAQKAVANVR